MMCALTHKAIQMLKPYKEQIVNNILKIDILPYDTPFDITGLNRLLLRDTYGNVVESGIILGDNTNSIKQRILNALK